MGAFVTILLIIVIVKSIIFACLIWIVFRDDIKEYISSKKGEDKPELAICMYCHSRWTSPVDEGQTKVEGAELVVVTEYRCEHCLMPFWNVKRLPLALPKTEDSSRL